MDTIKTRVYIVTLLYHKNAYSQIVYLPQRSLTVGIRKALHVSRSFHEIVFRFVRLTFLDRVPSITFLFKFYNATTYTIYREASVRLCIERY